MVGLHASTAISFQYEYGWDARTCAIPHLSCIDHYLIVLTFNVSQVVVSSDCSEGLSLMPCLQSVIYSSMKALHVTIEHGCMRMRNTSRYVDPYLLVKPCTVPVHIVPLYSRKMARVLLPCEVEEWWEDKRLFLLLSHMRTIKDFDLLISSHTRKDQNKTLFFKRLTALQGLRVFLANYCTVEEQNTFFTSTLPCIAKAASFLDERVPDSGIPFLSKQECK